MTQPDYEAAKQELAVKQVAPPIYVEPGEVNVFDDPSGPPDTPTRNISPALMPVVNWLTAIVNDESLLLDLCMDRAIEILNFQYKRGAVGIDLFADVTGGKIMNRAELVLAAVPLAIRLYDEGLKAVESRSAEFQTLVAQARQKMVQEAVQNAPHIIKASAP